MLWQPPKALKRPKTLVGPNGDKREDPYYWLRDDARTDPEIRAHLEVWPAPMSQLPRLLSAMLLLLQMLRARWSYSCQCVFPMRSTWQGMAFRTHVRWPKSPWLMAASASLLSLLSISDRMCQDTSCCQAGIDATSCSAHVVSKSKRGMQCLRSPACRTGLRPARAQAETAFTHACLSDTADLREQLYQEMRGAIQEADQTAPLRCARSACLGACYAVVVLQ